MVRTTISVKTDNNFVVIIRGIVVTQFIENQLTMSAFKNRLNCRFCLEITYKLHLRLAYKMLFYVSLVRIGIVQIRSSSDGLFIAIDSNGSFHSSQWWNNASKQILIQSSYEIIVLILSIESNKSFKSKKIHGI